MKHINYNNYAMKSLLKNLILGLIQKMKITKILKKSNFLLKDLKEDSISLLFTPFSYNFTNEKETKFYSNISLPTSR
jgi:hypothetical protein